MKVVKHREKGTAPSSSLVFEYEVKATAVLGINAKDPGTESS